MAEKIEDIYKIKYKKELLAERATIKEHIEVFEGLTYLEAQKKILEFKIAGAKRIAEIDKELKKHFGVQPPKGGK